MSKVSLNEVKQLLKTLQPRVASQRAATLQTISQQPLEQPTGPLSHSLPQRQLKSQSNVLFFRNRNQLLHPSDFTKLHRSDLQMFQARDSNTLSPKGGYFLLFPSHDEASMYMFHTLGKTLNGVNLYLEMCDPSEKINLLQNVLDESFHVKTENGVHILEYSTSTPRDHYVVARGFPPFITENTLNEMLWEYDLDSAQCLNTDKIGKVSTWLLKFNNSLDPQRFNRRFHAKHFDNDTRLPKVYTSQLN